MSRCADLQLCLYVDFEIQSIDGCIWENGLSNKTDLYDSVYYEKALIIRRGQPFHLRLNLASESKVDLTSVFLHLKTSSKPSKRSGTWIQVGLKGDGEEDVRYCASSTTRENIFDSQLLC